MKILRFFSFIAFFGLTCSFADAQTPLLSDTDPVNGNRIPEPELKDHQIATRVPGILFEPYDIVDSNGVPETTPDSL